MPSIVTVSVTQTIAPTPSTLQKTGAFVSQGGTTLSSGEYALLTQFSELTPILSAALSVTGITQTSGTATATTAAAHGITSGDTFLTAISGALPAAYSGTVLATSTGTDTFTYAVPTGTASPATGTITFTPRNVAELVAMATTFFNQGGNQAVYVLELGGGEPSAGVTALTSFINASPQFFYSYLVPRSWDGVSSFLTFLADFEDTTAKTYFFVTTTTETYSDYTDLMKCVFWEIEAPNLSTLEFSAAAAMFDTLNYNPSSTNKVTPLAFTFQYGVTPYPTVGNSALLTEIKAAGGNYIATGAEGGISDTIIVWGQTADSNQFDYWYSVDWAQINSRLNIANAAINGSNNPTNPLYYNQSGINSLQDVAVATMNSAITFGLGLSNGNVVSTALSGPDYDAALASGAYNGQIVVNAVPFIAYLTANPSDYKTGTYNGLSVQYITQQGFTAIGFNINVTDFVTQG